MLDMDLDMLAGLLIILAALPIELNDDRDDEDGGDGGMGSAKHTC